MVETVAAAALEAGCRVLVVVGCRAAEVSAPFAGPAFEKAAGEGRLLMVENAAWAEGMLGSIQAALPLARGEAFFSMNADMPLVGPSAYRLLAEARDARYHVGAPGPSCPAPAASGPSSTRGRMSSSRRAATPSWPTSTRQRTTRPCSSAG
jgi:CTP:molybdopterin cytidylyltransferase MocA